MKRNWYSRKQVGIPKKIFKYQGRTQRWQVIVKIAFAAHNIFHEEWTDHLVENVDEGVNVELVQ